MSKEVEVKVNESKKIESVPVKITATFITKDIDGLKTKHVYKGTGKTVVEALADVKNIETDEEFPKVNLLVNTTVEKGKKVIEKALAPHKARALFCDKREDVFGAVYRGL